MTKLPDHFDERIDFRGIAVIGRGEVPHRGFESRDEHLRGRQTPRVDNLRHHSSISESAKGGPSSGTTRPRGRKTPDPQMWPKRATSRIWEAWRCEADPPLKCR